MTVIDPFQKSDSPCGISESSNVAALMAAMIGDHGRLKKSTLDFMNRLVT